MKKIMVWLLVGLYSCLVLLFVSPCVASMQSTSQIISELRTPAYKALGFRQVWTEGDKNHILKISVDSNWYRLPKRQKEQALTLIGENWKKVHTCSTARLSVEDYYSGKEVGYYGVWGAKIKQ